MKKYNNIDLESRDIQRSNFRNLPENCMYCAYRFKPSSSCDSCATCWGKTYKIDSIKTTQNKP